MSHINASISITPDPESIRHHIYDDGAAFIDLTASFSPTASVQLWVGRQGADLPADAAALRKLAAAATEVAAHLERRRVQLEREKEAQQ